MPEPHRTVHQRWWAVEKGVVEGRSRLAADLDQVLEPGTGHQGDPGSPAFEEGIGPGGGAVQEHAGARPAHLFDCLDHSRLLGPRSRHFGPAQRLAIEDHDVGEGAPDIHSDR